MGFYDRSYYDQDNNHHRQARGMSLIFPGLTPVVKYLLIINVAVFFFQSVSEGQLEYYFAAVGYSWQYAIQLWRLITFQFLHGHGWHLIGNMLGLYFLGTLLERTWGSRKFLIFYLLSGAVGGALFVIASVTGIMTGVLVGASGGVLGLLAACAVLFPQIKVLLFFIFPMQIRTLAIFISIFYFFNVIRMGENAGGNLCHLGGIVTGLVWVLWGPYWSKAGAKQRQFTRQRSSQLQAKHELEVDRILAKVHEKGIHSLSRQEKQILQQATKQQKKV